MRNEQWAPLRSSLRLYWRHLVPIALLPTIMTIFNRLPVGVIGTILSGFIFFGSAIYAYAPCFSNKASPLFWLVAVGAYAGGGICLSIILWLCSLWFG